MDEIFVADCRAFGTQFRNDALDLQGVPQHHSVGQQAEATGLVHDHFEVGGAELALIGEEQPPGQTMASLSAVELGLDAQAQRSIVQVAQDVAGLYQSTKSGERL